MSEVKKVIDIALNEVGYLEKASNNNLDDKTANAGSNNYTKYARDLDNMEGFYNGKKNGYAWCDVFVDWCFVKAFGRNRALELLCQTNGSCGAGCVFSMGYFQNKGQLFNSPKVGDQIFFKDLSGEACHTGLVYQVDGSRVYTIEGNTSSDSGLVANGGAVAKKSYSLDSGYIAGYGRPNYKESAEKPTEEPIKESETKPIKKRQIDVDGKWGNDTTRKAQEIFGTYVDGIISNQYIAYKNENPGLLSATFEWENNPTDGSDLIKAIQKRVGVSADGFIGPNTIKAMQKWLGTIVDGCVSNPSDMVKAFQKWLNNQ